MIRKFAENAMQLSLLRQQIAEKENVVTAINLDSKRNLRIDHYSLFKHLETLNFEFKYSTYLKKIYF